MPASAAKARISAFDSAPGLAAGRDKTGPHVRCLRIVHGLGGECADDEIDDGDFALAGLLHVLDLAKRGKCFGVIAAAELGDCQCVEQHGVVGEHLDCTGGERAACVIVGEGLGG